MSAASINIVHITGLSGSGKTTIGRALKEEPAFIVIDTDDIDDKNAQALIDAGQGWEWPNLELIVENSREFARLIKEAPAGKIVVIVGMIIDMPTVTNFMKPTKLSIDGYYLDVDPMTIYRQLNLRHLDIISREADRLRDEIKSTDDPILLNNKMVIQYKLRGMFPVTLSSIVNQIKQQRENSSVDGYRFVPPEILLQALRNLAATIAGAPSKN